MLFKQPVLAGIAAGQVTLAFRRWRRPSVKAGGRLRTPVGVLAIGSVEEIALRDIRRTDAPRAGFASLEELLADLERQRDGTLFRIAFRLGGADPRNALRAQAALTADARGAIAQRLDRLDAGKHGIWTRPVLVLIAREPGTRAADLAAALGEPDLKRFKTNVRKLKELGLTESLEVGYRLSPRGRAFLGRRSRRAP